MDSLTEPINVSALNQYSYCPRRCALIYQEGDFRNNIHTARGNAEHARVDRTSHKASCDGARIEYALPIWSERLGLVGKCDLVEFRPDGTIYPVEYKHGPRKARHNDDLQLAAQALCLEEMTGCTVPAGAIFHHGSRRRREIVVSASLRGAVELTVIAVRELIESRKMPPPVNDARCSGCSMIDSCLPQVIGNRARFERALADLYRPA